MVARWKVHVGEVSALGPARRDDGGGDAAGVDLALVEVGVAGEDEGVRLRRRGLLPGGGLGEGEVRGDEQVARGSVDLRGGHHGRVRRSAEDLPITFYCQ